jgi:hypothetical protein
MPLNIASNTAKSRASFGPGVLYIGATGSTPTEEIGLIGDDGATFEVSGEQVEIRQGNPGIIEFAFFSAQNAMLGISSLEWEVNRLKRALGAGATTVSASQELLEYGGEPCVEEVAVWLEHRKCTAVHTVNIRLWKAISEAGAVSVGLNAGAVHQFGYRWKGIRSATNWAGGSLASDRQLFQVDIAIT